jgi:hypothetical protein
MTTPLKLNLGTLNGIDLRLILSLQTEVHS